MDISNYNYLMIIILTTIGKKEIARKIGKSLLKNKLIACYNLFPVESAYWWKGKIVDDSEILMVLKTTKTNFKKVEDHIKKNSGYEVPEIVAINPHDVHKPYLNWLYSVIK